MWFSRVWFILLTILTSALVSGALNTSSTKERHEHSAHEVELLTERHALQLSVESSNLASQPEVIHALSSQYQNDEDQRLRFDELFESWLLDHPLAVDAMLLNPALSKDCPPGGGECIYRPLRSWGQSTSVEEVINTLDLRPLKTEETFVPRWAWVGDTPQLMVALPVTKQNTLGVVVVAGYTLNEVIALSIKEVKRKWGGDHGLYSVYLGDKVILCISF